MFFFSYISLFFEQFETFVPPADKKIVMFKRHLAKTISYRILGTLTTVSIAFLAGLNWEISSLLGVGELFFKPLIYFLHERFWYRFIKYGIKK
jgi:uncharacterized membrane protein